MKRISDKKLAELAAGDERRYWSCCQTHCWLCGGKYGTGGRYRNCHEMVGGNTWRRVTVLDRHWWFSCCQRCHETLTSTPKRDELIRLLRIKKAMDKENYSLRVVNSVWGKHHAPIKAREVT